MISPRVATLLRFFDYDHLPEELQGISAPFGLLAQKVAHELVGDEMELCLRKLLEAKDCAVRAALQR